MGGWRLSPLFDVNPDPDLGKVRVTSIAGTVAADDEPDALLELAAECRLSADRALDVVGEVSAAARQWREVAAQNGIVKAEQDRFADVLDGQLAALDALTR